MSKIFFSHNSRSLFLTVVIIIVKIVPSLLSFYCSSLLFPTQPWGCNLHAVTGVTQIIQRLVFLVESLVFYLSPTWI